jgi:hypothetical protein
MSIKNENENENPKPETPKPETPKRVVSEATLENLKRAREKALTNRQELKQLKEREDMLKKEELDARWEKLYEEEERIKSIKKPNPTKSKTVKTQNKHKQKDIKIIHVSPPLSEASSVVSSSEESQDEYVPTATSSRREHRKKAKTALNASNEPKSDIVTQDKDTKDVQNTPGHTKHQPEAKQALNPTNPTAEDTQKLEQLHRAMRALGMVPRVN